MGKGVAPVKVATGLPPAIAVMLAVMDRPTGLETPGTVTDDKNAPANAKPEPPPATNERLPVIGENGAGSETVTDCWRLKARPGPAWYERRRLPLLAPRFTNCMTVCSNATP